MREIGGFIEIAESRGSEYHENAIALNCGRSCLEYLIKAKNIQKMYIPYFLCASARNLCKKCGCEFEFYSIDTDFKPIITKSPKSDELVMIINYYGQVDGEYIASLKRELKYIVIDNTQSFFAKPQKDTDTLYSCRKFFGVPDGAYLYTDKKYAGHIETDVSHDRVGYLLGRYEEGPQKFYNEYVKNNARFETEDMKLMSKLTHNLLKNEDYDFVRSSRTNNFKYLHEKLFKVNKLKLKIPDGPFMYPFLVDDGEYIRQRLIENKIFVPTLWAATFEVATEGSVEWNYSKNIVPLPIDQRYGTSEMECISSTLFNILEEM